MTRIIKILGFASLVLTLFPIAAQAQECDRACLENFVVGENSPNLCPTMLSET